MKDIIEITFFITVLLAVIPCVIYLWITFVWQILEKKDFFSNLNELNSELMDEIIARDEEIKYLKEHIKNSQTK